MTIRKSLAAVTAVAMLLSASLVMAQDSNPATSSARTAARTAAGKTKAAAGAAATTAKQAGKVAAGTAATTARQTAKGVAGAAGGVATTAQGAAAGAQKTTAGATTTAKEMAAKAAVAAGGLVDLNGASKAELMKLPGIGEALSAKIIAGRPWANKTQLVSRGVVTQAAYAKLQSLVVARQAK